MSLFPLSNYATTAADAPAVAVPNSRQSTPVAPAVVTTKFKPVKDVDTVGPAADKQSKADNARLDQAVEAINKFLKPVASSLEFSVDEDSGRTLVKVIDTDTNDVLRQYPSKEALAISQELGKLQGLLLKDKA